MTTLPCDPIQAVYDKFSNFDSISYNCIKYLMDNDEETWKLMYYNDADCWNKTNLTLDQKASLIYDGSPDETLFRVFQDSGQDNSWTVQACILRITPILAHPTNYVFGMMAIGFEVYSHYKINHTSLYKTRLDMMAQRLIEVFNGAEIPGLGRLFFDSKASSYCRLSSIGAIPYKGKSLILCTQSLG